MKNHKLIETVADISYLSVQNKFYSGDSRSDISEFIRWAVEFEGANTNTNWDEHDYIISIERFTQGKLRQV